MSGIYENAKSTTGTATRVRDISPISGMCPICIKECSILCEVSKSAFRGREVLYPSPEYFGKSTAASNKDYLMDWSYFQIQVELIGAKGIEPNPDRAIFENVDISTKVASQSKYPINLKIPVLIAGLGSTSVAKKNWDGISIGAAISGTIQTIGENICGMDDHATYTNGKVTKSPEMDYRIEAYRKFWDGKYGDIVVQTNVEDQRGGVDLYVLSKLEVNTIERKWGQGAKAIGGEVRIDNLDKALRLKNRGYIVLPDPEDSLVREAYKAGTFKTFERHSRVGFPEKRSFVEDVEWLREQGAKRVFLKTGAYRPQVVAFTMKCASEAKIDLVTFDGAGGGTGMSPVPMMHECATPTVHLEAHVLKCAEILRKKGKYIPDLAMAGGFVNETQIFKAIAMSNLDGKPLVKAISMARAPLTAAMKASYFVELAGGGNLPAKFANFYGKKPEKFFIKSYELRKKYGNKVGKELPWSAVGVYTYFVDRIGTGLKQLLAGTRKFKLELLERTDLVALNEYASKVTGIPTLEKAWGNVERELERILDY
jgi:glutamate synthase domain-containing protein 2